MPSRSQQRPFRVLVATDGSAAARAAVSMACSFPWPRGARARGIVAVPPQWIGGRPEYVKQAMRAALQHVAQLARRQLARRWPAAEVSVIERTATDAIVDSAKRFNAAVIVVGWRGHGLIRRALMGSVSRGVVERADRPVLVVRRRVRELRRAVIGLDGSPNAARAVDFAARLAGGGRPTITVVSVVEPVTLPTGGLLPKAVRTALLDSAAAMNRQLVRRARRQVEAAAVRLRRGGWRVRTAVPIGIPLKMLLEIRRGVRGDLIIVGARGVRGLERALLGSVAVGVLNQCPVPVLVVR